MWVQVQKFIVQKQASDEIPFIVLALKNKLGPPKMYKHIEKNVFDTFKCFINHSKKKKKKEKCQFQQKDIGGSPTLHYILYIHSTFMILLCFLFEVPLLFWFSQYIYLLVVVCAALDLTSSAADLQMSSNIADNIVEVWK